MTRYLLPLLLLTACAAGDEADASLAELNAGSPKLAATERAFAQLDAMKAAPPIGQFYEGGTESTRVRACWKNPVARKLTDMQKAFYCAVPLELRLCNSPLMLRNAIDEATAGDQNVTFNLNSGFKRCQAETEKLFAGRFVWTPEIDDLYLNLFLRRDSGLTEAEEARIIEAHRPKSGGFFPFLLVGAAASLDDEAELFGHSLLGVVRDAQLDDPEDSDI